MRLIGGVIVLALSLTSATAVEDFDAWFDSAFESMGSTFEEAWESAFEKSWDEAFGDGYDADVKAQFRETFRAAFETSFMRSFQQSVDETNATVERDESVEWKINGEYDASKIRWEETLTFERAADGLDRLDLSGVNGNVEVVGENIEAVHVSATRVVRATDEDRGRSFRDAFFPTVREEDGALIVETYDRRDKKENKTPRFIKEARISYEVVVPMRFAAIAKTVNGNVTVRDVEESAELHTVNGNVTFSTEDGLAGGVVGKTVNGQIRVEAIRLSERCAFETVNGNVEMTARDELDGGVYAKTLNGSIKLRVPSDAAFRLRGKVGMHGAIDTDWGKPVKPRKGLRFGQSYDVDVNGGGDDVRLETFNGTIDVRRTD